MTASAIESWAESERSQRLVVRRAIVLSAELSALRHSWPCLVLDISPRGAGLRLPVTGRLQVGAVSHLRLQEFGTIRSEIRHLEPAFVGLMFQHRGARDAEMARWLELLNVR